MKSKRIVLDTNVVVSGLFFKLSKEAQILIRAMEHEIILATPAVLEEWHCVLRRPKFNKYISIENRERFLSRLVSNVEIVGIEVNIKECRDAKDDKFLELAVSGNADYIITGDADLLILNPFRNIPILTPNQFLNLQSHHPDEAL